MKTCFKLVGIVGVQGFSVGPGPRQALRYTLPPILAYFLMQLLVAWRAGLSYFCFRLCYLVLRSDLAVSQVLAGNAE